MHLLHCRSLAICYLCWIFYKRLSTSKSLKLKFVLRNRGEECGFDPQMFYDAAQLCDLLFFVWDFLEPNLSSAEPDRAAGAAPGGKPPNHQSHKGLCDGAHRHRSCVSQRPPAIQKCQWFLGPTIRRSPHFPGRQTPGLPVFCRQPRSAGRSGVQPTFL